MSPKMWKVLLLVVAAFQISFGARYEVGADYAYKTIQSAVNAAKDGDEVVIMDFAVYKEQVVISKKKNFTLRSDNPKSAKKPAIVWQDRKDIGPTTCADAKIDSLITFDQNGGLQILRCTNIYIEGIKVDGGGRYFFGKNGIWDGAGGVACKEAMQHGNAAIAIFVSGGVVIRDCEITNAYFGLSYKDRNLGGVYANTNPSDNDKVNNVPLSGFGQTGNHLLEYNSIHGNCFGAFYESTWDLGSVVRYNLFYDNYMPDSMVAKVKALTSDGGNQVGGAMFFKDHCLSPLAIHNNTFWRNSYNLVNHWRGGKQHLIFNNIYAKPNVYWARSTIGSPFVVADPAFAFRTFNSVYACFNDSASVQMQNVQAYDQGLQKSVVIPVKTYQPRIMNQMGDVQGITLSIDIPLSDSTVSKQTIANAKMPGNLIVGTGTTYAYPASANIRWLETKFLSTTPTDPNFLVPDWEDSLVKLFIPDQGWAGSSIKDPDGTAPDLGAIPKTVSRVKYEFNIKPMIPVQITGTQATAMFSLGAIDNYNDGKVGSLTNPVIKYARWIDKIPNGANMMGGNGDPIMSKDIIDVKLTGTQLKMGDNAITFTVPARDTSNKYSFLELVVEGTDPDGQTVQSIVGFLPYRTIDYEFLVEIYDKTGNKKLNEVRVGDTVQLKLTPRKLGEKNPMFNATIAPTVVGLSSGYSLLNPARTKLDTIPSVAGTVTKPVVFTKVPLSGIEVVLATGIYQPNATQKLAIAGASEGIKIIPGDPALVRFADPPSRGKKVIDPGAPTTISAQVFDEYENKINQQTDVVLTSLRNDIGDVYGPATQKTDSTGKVKWQVEVKEGNENDTFDVTAQLVVKPAAVDQATIVVGKARDRLWVFYADVAKYDPSVVISECSSERVPVTIKRLANGTTLIDTMDVTFDIELSPGLAAYASMAATDSVKITSAKLVKGQALIYVKATAGQVSNGMITVYPNGDPSVLKGSRAGISFEECITQIASAAYFADNGFGSVSRLEIRYKAPITLNEVPDSLELYWPSKTPQARRMVVYDKTNMVLDGADSTHLTVYIRPGFDSLNTTSFTTKLGTSYWKNKLLEEGEVKNFSLTIADSVGPLLSSATLIERLDPQGMDTLLLTFTEPVNISTIRDTSLALTKNGPRSLNLNVVSAVPQGGADTIKIVLNNMAGDAPVGGDLLSILSSGPITDQFGNKAHPQNRPVPIKVRGVPPGITSASYFDTDADGVVETVVIDFNKKVEPKNMGFSFVWADTGGHSDTLDGAVVAQVNPQDSSILTVSIKGAFKNGRITNKTSGRMDVIVFERNFGTQILSEVKDKAAPVLVSAVYSPGKAISETQFDSDMFSVKFSESVQQQSNIKRPFVFISMVEAKGYTLTLKPPSAEFNYVVDSINGVRFPVNGDSVWMLAEPERYTFFDDQGNYQVNVNNKRVKLVVKEIEYNVKLNVYPNPFTEGDSVRVVVKPITKMVENIKLVAKIVVYDNLGNKVFAIDNLRPNMLGIASTIPGAVEWVWNGKNLKGRKVAPGTYLGRIHIENEQEVKADPQNAAAGVVTEKTVYDLPFYIGLRRK